MKALNMDRQAQKVWAAKTLEEKKGYLFSMIALFYSNGKINKNLSKWTRLVDLCSTMREADEMASLASRGE